MYMSKCFRKEMLEQSTWHDKSAEKHKHDFSIKCLLEQRRKDILARYNNYEILYEHAYLCSKCHSFIIVSKELYKITTKFDEEKKKVLSLDEEKLPRIIAYNNSKFVNSTNFDSIQFPGGYIYERKGK